MAYTRWKNDKYITNFMQFDEFIRLNNNKLRRLDEFPNCVLVTGCQRSGTTMISRIITESDGMVKFWFGPDDELDAALILSGYVEHSPQGRYCFQTTYINVRYHEYFEHDNGHKIIWVLRNPASVTYSMIHNWRALDRLFHICGTSQLTSFYRLIYKCLGIRGISRLRRACFTYNGKVSQLFELRQRIGPETLLVVNYEDLVVRKTVILPEIYSFINLEYQERYADKISVSSLNKAAGFSKREISIVKRICDPVYQKAKEYTLDSGNN